MAPKKRAARNKPGKNLALPEEWSLADLSAFNRGEEVNKPGWDLTDAKFDQWEAEELERAHAEEAREVKATMGTQVPLIGLGGRSMGPMAGTFDGQLQGQMLQLLDDLGDDVASANEW